MICLSSFEAVDLQRGISTVLSFGEECGQDDLIFYQFDTIFLLALTFQFKFRKDDWCRVACRQTLGRRDAESFRDSIEDEYSVNM